MLWGYIRRHWWQYLLGIAALFVVDLLHTWIPEMTGNVTDGLKEGTLDNRGLKGMVLRILLAGFIITLGRFFWRYFLFGASRAIEKEIRDDLFGHLETLSMRYFNFHKTGDLMAHFTNDLQAVRQLLGSTVVTTFDASVMLVLVLVKMIRYVSPRLTLAAVLPMILIIFGDIFFGKAMHKRFLEKQAAFSSLTDQTQEAVSGIRVIKAFVQEKKELLAFSKVNLLNREKNLGVARLMALVIPLLNFVVGISTLITLLYGGRLAILGEITLGQFVAFNSYVGMLVWPMIAVGECVSSFSQGMASVKRVDVILKEKPDITDGPGTRMDITALRGGIDLKDLSFAYPGAESKIVLDRVSVSVAPGETLAVIGRTGCGKTTLMNLLVRLYDTADKDMIAVDGVPVRDIPLRVLRRDIAYVPQDSFLFSDTIAANISFGVDGAGREAVERAAKAAKVHDNIMEFPDGYDTVTGERGVTLSGGQRQRVAIARALLKDAPILMLDDALSAVDTDTEREIVENLKALRRGRTTLIIAHRISTVRHADHILVLEDGRRAEYGTHEELMSLGGIYRDLYEKQQLETSLYEEGREER
ncbi:MAG: ABC transporter ATP-binding protein [Clostridia bacterium]|nr:ABC transporter ATP-binding protein [Clostridia bacterium]